MKLSKKLLKSKLPLKTKTPPRSNRSTGMEYTDFNIPQKDLDAFRKIVGDAMEQYGVFYVTYALNAFVKPPKK